MRKAILTARRSHSAESITVAIIGSGTTAITRTGRCGNTLNLSHPAVTHYAYECLKYWVETFHVDGFRFDGASDGAHPAFSQQAPLFEAIKTARCFQR